jgi:hypothetical protein
MKDGIRISARLIRKYIPLMDYFHSPVEHRSSPILSSGADLVFEKQKVQNQPALDGSDQNQALVVVKDRCASATRPVLAIVSASKR